MIYVLLWIISGLFGLHLLNIGLHKYILSDFYVWKKAKNRNYTNFDYLKGTLFGFLLGPFVIILAIQRFLSKEKLNEDDNSI